MRNEMTIAATRMMSDVAQEPHDAAALLGLLARAELALAVSPAVTGTTGSSLR